MFWKPVTTVIVGLGSVLAVQAEGEGGAEQKRAIGEVLAGAPSMSLYPSPSLHLLREGDAPANADDYS